MATQPVSGDIFDQVAASGGAVSSSGDIFDQIAPDKKKPAPAPTPNPQADADQPSHGTYTPGYANLQPTEFEKERVSPVGLVSTQRDITRAMGAPATPRTHGTPAYPPAGMDTAKMEPTAEGRFVPRGSTQAELQNPFRMANEVVAPGVGTMAHAPVSAAKGEFAQAGAETLGGAGELASMTIAPAALEMAASDAFGPAIKMAVLMGGGQAGSMAIEKYGKEHGWTPQQINLASQAVQWLPAGIHGAKYLAGVKTVGGTIPKVPGAEGGLPEEAGQVGPEPGTKFKGVTAFPDESGNPRVAAGITTSPEGKRSATLRVGKTSIGINAPGERPVVQGSDEPAAVRASAENQASDLKDMAGKVVEGVPGAKVEGARVKEAESIQNKEERGKPVETTIDVNGARISAETPEARQEVEQKIESTLPVVSKDKIDSNGLDATQYGVKTGEPGQANQVSEIQVLDKPQADALKQTDELYAKQKQAIAAGDQKKADELGKQITAIHEQAAAQPPEKTGQPKAGGVAATSPVSGLEAGMVPKYQGPERRQVSNAQRRDVFETRIADLNKQLRTASPDEKADIQKAIDRERSMLSEIPSIESGMVAKAPTAKEPWQMTQGQVSLEKSKQDFPITGNVEVRDGKPVYTYSATVKWGDGNRTFTVETRGPLNGSQSASRLHKKVVEAAIAEGKSVHPEVLAGYPDLKNKANEPKFSVGDRVTYQGKEHEVAGVFSKPNGQKSLRLKGLKVAIPAEKVTHVPTEREKQPVVTEGNQSKEQKDAGQRDYAIVQEETVAQREPERADRNQPTPGEGDPDELRAKGRGEHPATSGAGEAQEPVNRQPDVQGQKEVGSPEYEALKKRIAELEAKQKPAQKPTEELSLADEERKAGFPGPDWESKDFRVERSGAGQYVVRRKDGGKGTYGTSTGLSGAADKMRAAQKVEDNRTGVPEESASVEPARKFDIGDRVEYTGPIESYRSRLLKVGFQNSAGTSVKLDDVRTGERVGGWFSPTELQPSKRLTPSEQDLVQTETNQPVEPIGRLIDAIADKLSKGQSLGNVTELNRLADEHLGAGWRTAGEFTPKDVFDAMEAGVNKYLLTPTRSRAGQEPSPAEAFWNYRPEDALDALKDLEQRLTSQGVRTEEQITHQQFSTPPRESFVVSKVADIKPSDVVLEPSAGNGGLAVWAKAIGAEVHVNEIAPRRQKMLEAIGFGKPTAEDGEIINAMLDPKIKPTVVVMNPPFSSKALASGPAKNRSQYGFNHVDSALQRLAPGGRLVAILGGGRDGFPNEGASLNNTAAREWFEKIAKQYNVRANIRVSGKEYHKYGTSYATRIIVIDKDGPTADLMSTQLKDANTLEEAYNALRQVAESRPQGGSNVTSQSPGIQSAGGTRETEPSRRVGSDQDAGVPSVRVPAGRVGTTDAEVPAAVRPGRTGTGVTAPRSSSGSEQLPVHPEGNRPAERPESEAAGSAGAGVAHGEPQRQVAERGLDLEVEEAKAQREEDEDSAYTPYQPTLKGAKHPGSIVETKSMATVPMPPLTYKPNLPENVVGKGPDYDDAKLSSVQLEAVSIAGMQNEIKLPNGARASALIGDGTGVGKGREGAAILWDNWRKGRTRLVWMTKSKDLINDAVRDLEALGASDLAKNIRNLGKVDASTPIDHKGVLFTTYSLFRSGDKKGNTRAAQVDRWLRGMDDGDGGYLLMDESHNLKNAVVAQGQQASQIGQVVKKFLENMPALRTVSLSATAATDVMNLGYLDRLGLWGPGTPFPGGFVQFAGEIANGGMSAMEMIARELKAQGKYVARTLTFKGVKYSEIKHEITPEQKEIYGTAAQAWREIFQSIEHTITHTTNGGGRQKAMAMSQFFSTQQRFFNLLLTSIKIPTAVKTAEEALANGQSVAITLINTNEAAQNRERDRVAAEDSDEEPDYDFGPGKMLSDMVREHYPTQQYKDDVDANGNPVKVPVVDAKGNPVQNPEAVKARDELLAKLDQLAMPNNPLDELIEQLGGPGKVAELTGRKQRFDASKNRLVNRGGSGVSQDKVNVAEMAAFQSGKKRIAILSSAADTGISLHADRNAKNQQPRLCITLQVGWSADKALQMMGRFNRSNQLHPPEYALLKTDAGGESRFISSIARRMESLEALSKGQTKTNVGTEAMSKVNFETDQGRAASTAFYNRLLNNGEVPGTVGPDGNPLRGRDILKELRVLKGTSGGGVTVPPADRPNVTRLLNRLLALPLETQQPVYDYFYDIFSATVQDAIDAGTLDTGVKRIPGDTFDVKEFKTLASDPATGAKTFYYPVDAHVRTQRKSVADAEKIIARARKDGDKPAIYRSKTGKLVLAVPARKIVHADGTTEEAVHVVRPENGVPEKAPLSRYQKIDYSRGYGRGERIWEPVDKELSDKIEKLQETVEQSQRDIDRYTEWAGDDKSSYYQGKIDAAVAENKQAKLDLAEAEKQAKNTDIMDLVRDEWQKAYDDAPSHVTSEHHLIGGAVMRYWNAIREASGQRLDVYSTVDQKTGQRVVGVEIPASQIHSLLARITGGKSTVTAEQIVPDVLKNATAYDLEGGIKIRGGRVAGNNVVQLVTADTNLQKYLKDKGVLYEKGLQPIYYLPTDRYDSTKGRDILDKILADHPVKSSSGGSVAPTSESVTAASQPGPGAQNKPAPSDTAKQSSLSQLSESIRRQKAIDRLKEKFQPPKPVQSVKEAISDALSSLVKGTKALVEAYKNPRSSVLLPHGGKDVTDYERAVGKWSGDDNRSAWDIYRFRRATKDIPERRAEAMSNWIEAGENNEVLNQRADDSEANPDTKKYARGYRDATNLTDEEKTIARNIQTRNDAVLEEMQKAGVLQQGVENFVTHLYKNRPDLVNKVRAQLNFDSLTTKPYFTKKRSFPTYFDAEQKGFEPKSKNIFYLTAVHERALREALAAREFIKSLKDGKASDGRPLTITSWASARQVPSTEETVSTPFLIKPNIKKGDEFGDYRVLDHPALRGWRWAGEDGEGNPIIVQGDMLVHPEIYRHLKNNLTKGAISNYAVNVGGMTVRPGEAALELSSAIKHTILTLSRFHETTLEMHALEHRTNPWNLVDLDMADPDQKALVDGGMMVAHYEGMDAFSEGLNGAGPLTKIPGVGPFVQAYQDHLFKEKLPQLKMTVGLNALMRNRELYKTKGYTDEKIAQITAKEMNAAFGGLNYRMLGRNRTMQEFLRLSLMAPDFLEARAKFVSQAARPEGREQLIAYMLGAAVLYTVARILNELADGKPHWDSPFEVIHHGKSYSMRSVQEDTWRAISEPAKFGKNRLSPPVNYILDASTGRDRFGRKITLTKRLEDAGRTNVPIPFQPWTRASHDSNAQKAAETALRVVGINVKKEQKEHR